MHIENICKKVVTERRVLGENKVSRGVITGIPIYEDLEKIYLSILTSPPYSGRRGEEAEETVKNSEW